MFMKQDKRLIYPEYTKSHVHKAGEAVRNGKITPRLLKIGVVHITIF